MKLEPIDQLREVIKIQCDDGNWNYDPYMHGMANGLLLALSIIDQSHEPQFLNAPTVWLKDISYDL